MTDPNAVPDDLSAADDSSSGRSPDGRPPADPSPADRSPSPGDRSLDGLRERLSRFAAARAWEPFHTPKNLAAALSVEAGELLEIFQWLTPEQAGRIMSDPESAHRVRDEVADVLAYLLQFCTVTGVDPLAALAAKIDRNELRFPAPGGQDG